MTKNEIRQDLSFQYAAIHEAYIAALNSSGDTHALQLATISYLLHDIAMILLPTPTAETEKPGGEE